MTQPPSYLWIKPATARWASDAAAIMREHGAVSGVAAYEARHQARYQAQKLIGLLVELEFYERSELCEHTNRTPDGWVWAVQCVEWRRGEPDAGRDDVADVASA